MKKAAVIFACFGPYHVARLERAGACFAEDGVELVGIEIAPTDSGYGWYPTEGESAFRRVTLFPTGDYASVPSPRVRAAVRKALDAEQPHAVALPGWASPAALAGLGWCRRNGVRAVVMSESSEHDFPRRWWREWLKRRIVRKFDAALVGGRTHAEYARKLGIPAGNIHLGYDVVDNAHFAEGADRARRGARELRQQKGLPENYFLSVGRFVPKKNIPVLLEGFARYREQAGDNPWHLVLCGDGRERPRIRAEIERLGLTSVTHLPGIVQYDTLPVYYGLAGAFVHVSTVEQWGLVVNEAMASGLPVVVSEPCGCASELVQEGINGYVVTPRDPDDLARILLKLSARGANREPMAIASRKRIEALSPREFAAGLREACRADTPPLQAVS